MAERKFPCKDCIYNVNNTCQKCGYSVNYMLLYGTASNCEDYLSREEYERNRWFSLTDKAIVNYHQKRIILHDFTATKHINIERAMEEGYTIEFETDPFH